MTAKKKQMLYVAIGLFLIAFLLGLLNGCEFLKPHLPPPIAEPPYNPVHHPFVAMHDTLAEIDSLMGVVYALSIAVFGLGVVLMFYLRTSFGPALMAGGLGTLLLSLFIKSLIWFVPWIAGGVLLVGLIAFIVDVRKRGFTAALHDVQNLVSHAAPANS